MFSALNQITAHLERPPYKQEVGGSWPSAPTTPSTTYEPSGSPDTLPEAALRSDSVPYLCPECRELDSVHVPPRTLSNLLIPETEQTAYSAILTQGTHGTHTARRQPGGGAR